jgi:folate-binding protein YgfZ
VSIFQLGNRSVVRVSGADAHKLLNDTLTCRFDDGLDGVGRWFALLSPQGKVQVEGLVTRAADAYWFDIETGLVGDLLKRMKLYRLRAKVELAHETGRAVLWSPDGEGADDAAGIGYRDSRAEGLGTRYLVARENPGEGESPAAEPVEAYETARIGAGIAEIGTDFGVNEMFPHDIGMDLAGGLDFLKGCYVGQEVVSRMQHRGTARRRPVIVSGLTAGAEAGTPVVAGAREAGSIGVPIDGRAVAILRLDRITDPGAVTVGGRAVTLALPAWASYTFGESAAAE